LGQIDAALSPEACYRRQLGAGDSGYLRLLAVMELWRGPVNLGACGAVCSLHAMISFAGANHDLIETGEVFV
jgi:hypothetical protein